MSELTAKRVENPAFVEVTLLLLSLMLPKETKLKNGNKEMKTGRILSL